MKVKFLKDHLSNKAGDEVDMNDGIADYLIRMQVAEKKIIEAGEKKKGVRPVNKKNIEKP